MKLKILIVVALATMLGRQGYCPPNNYGPRDTPSQQAAVEQAQIQWQTQAEAAAARQQAVRKANKAASQAAACAQQAAVYNNDASRQAAANAAQAAADAKQAAYDISFVNSPMVFQDAAEAEQAADSTKRAAAQAEIDAAVTKLENERDAAVAQIKEKYAPNISDLEAQISNLKRKESDFEKERSQADAVNAHLRAKQLFEPKDPWRTLGGKVYNAKDESWFQFTGTVLEVRANGLLIHGDFGPPLEKGFGERDYFVENFPSGTYPLADGEAITLTMDMVAHLSTTASTYQFTNTTIDLRVNTVRRLDYGQVVTSPPPDLAQKWNNIILIDDSNPELTKQFDETENQQSAAEAKLAQLNSDFDKEKAPINAEYDAKIQDAPNVIARQAKEREDAKKQAAADGVVRYEQGLADKGDEFGLLRMGERYRDGNGVPKDLNKAKDYLQKAAAAGSPTAADDLKAFASQGGD